MHRLLLLFLATIIVFTTHPYLNDTMAETKTRPTDLKETGKAEIVKLLDTQIVTGFPDGTFRPDQRVTRAEAITMIARALDLNVVERATTFSDVPASHFASGAIESGVNRNIVTGYTDGTFRPNQTVTRAEMALFLSRAFEFTNTSNQYFIDVRSGAQAFHEINKLAANGITNGYSDHTYRPTQGITRHEFGLLLARVLYPEFRVKGKDPITYTKAVVYNAPTGLNIRTAPNTNNIPIGRLYNGTTVEYFTTANNFAGFLYKGRLAYVSSAYLRSPNTGATGSLSGITIVVDPGHGGRDPGAVAFGYREKDIVLAVSLLVYKKLEAAGANVVLTRDTDIYLTLAERAAIANQANASSFISIHANAAGSSVAHGTETFWNRTSQATGSKQLADHIQKHLIEMLNTNNRGVKEGNFHVIRETNMPSVLVELGFITNEAEAKRMMTAKFQEDAAEAILQGVLEFYNRK